MLSLVVEQLVLQHLIVCHWLAELVNPVQQEFPDFGESLELEFVHHITYVKHCSTVVEVLEEEGEG